MASFNIEEVKDKVFDFVKRVKEEYSSLGLEEINRLYNLYWFHHIQSSYNQDEEALKEIISSMKKTINLAGGSPFLDNE